MDSRRTKGPVCGIENCRSRLYDEGEDGFLYCQNGHRQGGLVRGEDDEDNYDTPAARTITRKRKDPSDEDTTKVTKQYSGRRAYDLYLKCLQLVLRHHIWFLVHEKGLPAELETIVFDLWALKVAKLEDKIASASQITDSQSQIYNTLESGDSETSGHDTSVSGSRDKKFTDTPNLYDAVALCYLGTLTLRLPITPGDFYAWVTDGKLAFHRAIKLVPLAMRDHLSPTHHAMLDHKTMLKYPQFYEKLASLQTSFEVAHGILWPPLNVPLLLFRYLKELALPLELYDQTIRLGDLLGHDFAFHYDGRSRLGLRYQPEAQLVGCLIVCIKLFYPLDKIGRHPQTSSEPSALSVDWKAWRKLMAAAKVKQREGDARLTAEEMINLTEEDAFNMLPEQLDQYLDFYVDTFLDRADILRTKDNDDFRNALYEMFPIEGKEHQESLQTSQAASHKEQLETVQAVHRSMKTTLAVADGEGLEEVVRPGQMYPFWKKEEDLPKRARVFYEEIGRIAGLSVEMIVKAVFQTESKAERWQRQQKRKNRASRGRPAI